MKQGQESHHFRKGDVVTILRREGEWGGLNTDLHAN